MSAYRLTVSTPDGNLFEGEAEGLFLRGADGDLAILAGHAPFLTTVQPGTCRIDLADGGERYGRVEGGILSVTAEGTVLLATSFVFVKNE